jgi:hypothetical protein
VKVTVSIPDPIFDAAEDASRRLRMPRSRFYSQAVEALVKIHRVQGVRKALEDLYAAEPSDLDPVLEELQAEALREAW